MLRICKNTKVKEIRKLFQYFQKNKFNQSLAKMLNWEFSL